MLKNILSVVASLSLLAVAPAFANKAEKARTDASMAGIGATLYEKGLVSAIRALGKEPKKEDVLPLFKLSDERPIIVAEDPDSDTPSGKAGLKKGDRITAVDGANVNGKTLDEVVSTIRGPAGTTVKLSIIRKTASGDQTMELAIVRAKFIIHVVKSEDLGNGITQIKLTHFESQYGTQEMYDALTKAAKGKAIILDLRGNPGGELSQPISMAAMFLEKGIVVQLIQRSDDGQLYKDAYEEAQRIIRISDEVRISLERVASSEPSAPRHHEPPWRRSRSGKRRCATRCRIDGVISTDTASSATTTITGVARKTMIKGASADLRPPRPKRSSAVKKVVTSDQPCSVALTASTARSQNR